MDWSRPKCRFPSSTVDALGPKPCYYHHFLFKMFAQILGSVVYILIKSFIWQIFIKHSPHCRYCFRHWANSTNKTDKDVCLQFSLGRWMLNNWICKLMSHSNNWNICQMETNAGRKSFCYVHSQQWLNIYRK